MSEKIKWDVINAEIKNDDFYFSIIELVRENDIKTILELGASAGDGSTEAFIIGKSGKTDAKLFSVEVCTERFAKLQPRYQNDTNFFAYNVSSVPVESFPPKSDIIRHYREHPELLSHSIATILGWYDNDVNYVAINGIPENGIEIIKKEHGIDSFDCVLIDSSEFTGKPELDAVYGAKFILLDDILGYKNYDNHFRLLKDPKYKLIKENKTLRCGYSIYKRVD